MKLLSILFILSILNGCSTTRDPKNLTPFNSSEYFVLKRDITYTGRRGMYDFAEGLRKGTYKAELQDATGTYYRGPGRCAFTMPSSHNRTIEYQGGLWIPRDGGVAKAQIYSYFSADNFFAENDPVTGVQIINPDGGTIAVPGVLKIPVYFDDGKIFIWDKVLSKDSLSNLEWRTEKLEAQ